MKRYDLVAIGAGTAANAAAGKCAAAGWSVAIVDELPYGGTCALRGCDPKKMLRRGAEIIDAVDRMRGRGVKAEALRIDWPELMAFKRSFTDAMPDRIERSLIDKGIDTYHGTAHFVGSNVLDLSGTAVEGRFILIASGARPRELTFPGAASLTDSTQFMELNELPRRILFIGGGLISFEFAHIAARAGSRVTIVDHGSPLKAFDPELVDMLVKRSHEVGIEFHPESELVAVEKSGAGYDVSLRSDGKKRNWQMDLVVHGGGRVPALDQLDLPAAGVEFSDRGVRVNEYLQSVSNPAVYAAGDASDTDGWPLTPVSSLEGRIAAANMLEGNTGPVDYRGIPTVVFTIPELARVGLLEREAKKRGLDYRVKFSETGDWYSNVRVGEGCAAAKVLIDNQSERILGAHLLGPEYSELINLFGQAIRLELTTDDLSRMVSVYPSVGSDLSSLL